MPQPGRLLRGASTSPACVGWGAALQEPHHSHFEACQARGTVIASQIPPPTSESARSPTGTRHGGSHFLLPPAVTEQRSDREQPRGRKSPRGETATSSPIRQVPAEHLLAAEITPKGGAPPRPRAGGTRTRTWRGRWDTTALPCTKVPLTQVLPHAQPCQPFK